MLARALGPMRRTIADARAELGITGTLTLLVAVSGGADSMALLGLLERVARADVLRLVVGHVDHRLRASSVAEAELVVATARARGHAHACTAITVAKGSGLAARARDLRRAALLAQADAHGAAAVVLAQTASDQAETVLLNLCRGAGPAGLSGMAAVERAKPRVALVRPLMHLTRDDTRSLALALGLPFVDDPTNDHIEHPRIRIRKRVLAELRELNPQVELRIAGAARSVRYERERAAAHDLPDATSLDAVALRSLPSGARRHTLRALCLSAGVPADALAERTIGAIDDTLARGLARKRWDLHRHTLHLGAGRLWVEGPDEGGNH